MKSLETGYKNIWMLGKLPAWHFRIYKTKQRARTFSALKMVRLLTSDRWANPQIERSFVIQTEGKSQEIKRHWEKQNQKNNLVSTQA